MRCFVLLLAACAPTVIHPSPVEVHAHYPLSGWPLNRVEVQALASTPALAAAIKSAVDKSMSPATLDAGKKLVLKVTLDELVASLEAGRWRARARLSAILTDAESKHLASYQGKGSFSRTDTLGVRSGELAAQEALDEGVRQLLKHIDGAAIPVTK